jgi:hypothetical protein
MLFGLKDKVVPGQKVTNQRSAFGETVAEYKSDVSGEGAVRVRAAQYQREIA